MEGVVDDSLFDLFETEYQNNNALRAVMSVFSQIAETNPRLRVIEVDLIQEKLTDAENNLDRNTIIKTLRWLEKRQIGRVIIGRRGGKSRFEAELPLKQLVAETGATAPWVNSDVSTLREETLAHAKSVSTRPVGQSFIQPRDGLEEATAKKTIRIRFELRSKIIIPLEFPDPLSKSDALKLAEIIKGLPFDS